VVVGVLNFFLGGLGLGMGMGRVGDVGF
jgi:hypothetical protein